MPTYAKTPAPLKVQQDTSKFHCWAASLESWIDCAKPGTPIAGLNKTQADLIRAYKDFTGAKDGLYVAKALMQIMFDFQMMLDLFTPTTPITGSKIAQRLFAKGYLWMFYLGGSLGGHLGHCEVVYGVVDSHKADAKVNTMDPWTGSHEVKEVKELLTRSQIFLCWKETSPSWSDDMFKIMSALVKARGVT